MQSRRIHEKRKELRLSQQKLADAVGVGKSTVSQWESGDYAPSGANLLALAKALGVTPEWITHGKDEYVDEDGFRWRNGTGSRVGRGLRNKPAQQNADLVANTSFTSIPVYEVAASAGTGAVVNSENIVDVMQFKHDWITHTLNATPKDLYLIHVQGESMTPTLHPGDVVLVDHRSHNQIQADGVYVLRMGDSLLVKRVQRLPGQKLLISSDNPVYQPYEIALTEASNDELSIIGRVVWSGKRM